MTWTRGLSARATRRAGEALLLGLAVSVAITALSRVGAFAGWEARAIDTFLFFRERTPSPAVVIVAIDDDAFRALGERQPIDRRFLAVLGDFLLASGARVVVLDVLLTRPSSPEGDGALIAAAGRWPPGRVAGATLAEGRAGQGFALTPIFSPRLSLMSGFPNAPVGDDGVIRRMAAVLPGADGGYLPSLALAATAGAAGYTPERLAGALRAGGRLDLPVVDGAGLLAPVRPIGVDALAHGVWRVDFTGGPGSVITFPAGPIVEMARAGVRATEDNPFNDKIVLVGATFAESRDFYLTPLGLMAGVEIQANMIHTMLARRALLPPSLALNLGLLAAMCLVSALLSLWLRPLWAGLASGAVIVLVVVASYEAYTRGGYWLDFVAPFFGMLAYLHWSARLARRRLRTAFGQYVSPEVLGRVMREGSDLAGEIRTVSILMSDVRGFTALSETLPPARVAEVMNEYFEAMVDVVLAHGGMVNDFIGDGMLAVFGAPAGDAEHAWHAVLTALEMLETLERLNARWQAAGGVTLAIGVAVNTGTVFAGSMGSPRKKKYTVMGDPVNTTARMEGLNSQLGTTILLSGATLAVVKERVIVEDRGSVMMKGKAEPVEIFELMRRA